MSKSLTRTTLICISLLPSLLGCGQEKSEFRPLTNGFGYVIVKGGIDVAPGAELHYRGTDGKDTLIWDNISFHVIITNDMAVFAGERLATDGGPHLHTYLFAVRAPGPAIDITMPVLRMGAKGTTADLTSGSPELSFCYLETKSNKMFVAYTPKSADLYFELTWAEISELLRQ